MMVGTLVKKVGVRVKAGVAGAAAAGLVGT